jgi:hypothetical protein
MSKAEFVILHSLAWSAVGSLGNAATVTAALLDRNSRGYRRCNIVFKKYKKALDITL